MLQSGAMLVPRARRSTTMSGASLIQRKVHRLERSVENIDAVDFFMIYHGHAVADGIFFDKAAQNIAVLFRNLLGIIQQRVKKVRR